jgi:hypothetical protein
MPGASLSEPEFEVVDALPKTDCATLTRRGRHPKLTQRRFKRIIDRIRNGLTIVAAVREEGFTYQALWLHLRQKPDWQAQVDEAEVVREEQWKQEAMGMFHNAVLVDWRAARDFLERRYPAEWALRNIIRATTGDDAIGDSVNEETLLKYGRLMLEFAKEQGEQPALQVVENQAG